MRDFRAAVSSLALAESWRQNEEIAPKVLTPLPGEISDVRRLTELEKTMLQDSFPEGDMQFWWCGIFAPDGTLLGITDDLPALEDELRARGLRPQRVMNV